MGKSKRQVKCCVPGPAMSRHCLSQDALTALTDRPRQHGAWRACLAYPDQAGRAELFAVYAFIAAGLEAMRAFSSRTAGPVFGHLLLGLVDLAAGVVALVWPGPTALVLVLIVGTWAVIAGIAEIVGAFAKGEPAGTRALFILGGLVSIAFGVVLFARPGVGAITLALLFGLYNLVYGARALVQGIELRRTGKTIHSAFTEGEMKAA